MQASESCHLDDRSILLFKNLDFRDAKDESNSRTKERKTRVVFINI